MFMERPAGCSWNSWPDAVECALARYGGEPLRAGEFVTTGTLTQALPAGPGDRWRAEAKGAEFADIEIRLA